MRKRAKTGMRHKFLKCDILMYNNEELFKAAWGLKMTCMTEDIYVDEIENDERGVAETFLDDSIIASNARPGTSFSRPVTSSKGPSQAIRYSISIVFVDFPWKKNASSV